MPSLRNFNPYLPSPLPSTSPPPPAKTNQIRTRTSRRIRSGRTLPTEGWALHPALHPSSSSSRSTHRSTGNSTVHISGEIVRTCRLLASLQHPTFLSVVNTRPYGFTLAVCTEFYIILGKNRSSRYCRINQPGPIHSNGTGSDHGTPNVFRPSHSQLRRLPLAEALRFDEGRIWKSVH